jgi:hypothetical protein
MDVYNINTIWDYLGIVDTICITTNGYVNDRGRAIMGVGNAYEAKMRIPNIDKKLGWLLKNTGNHVYFIEKFINTSIVSFPTKRKSFDVTIDDVNDFPGTIYNTYPNNKFYYGWQLKSEIKLIIQSSVELMKMIYENNWKSVLLPLNFYLL